MTTYTEIRREYLAEWHVWYKMCYSTKHNYKYYVETQVCKEWQGQDGFVNWFDHIGPRPGPEYVQDRINKFGDYEPGNVEWTTKTVSQRRQRRHTDECKMLALAIENGINKGTFYKRVYRGWDMHDAATLPPSNQRYRNRRV